MYHNWEKKCRRFRVPFSVFKEICSGIRGYHSIPEHGYDAKGAETVKLPLLVLGALRILGSCCTFDALEELTAVGQDTHRKFFMISFALGAACRKRYNHHAQ